MLNNIDCKAVTLELVNHTLYISMGNSSGAEYEVYTTKDVCKALEDYIETL